MNKRGFTLVELIGTIVILLVLSLLVFPNLLNLIKNSKKDISTSTKDFIYGQAKSYIYDNVNGYTLKEGNIYCIGLKDLVSKNYLNTPLKDAESGNDIDLSKQIEVKVNNNDYSYELVETCTPKSYYTDNSGANTPKLFNNMVPIKYENNKWLVADLYSKWYDYDAKEWANAVVLNSGVTKNVGDEVTEEEISLWYVWLPRYKYTIFNGNNGNVSEQLINITFENGVDKTGTLTCNDNADGSETCTDNTYGSIVNGTSTYTHPAFKFGSTNLTGFWIGKFEVSGSTSTITVKPNVTSLRNQTVSSFFTAIQNVKTTYGINNADSHMMKNMEWGAVAYLKQSKYGLGTTDIAVNDNASYYTGGGTSDAYKTNVAQSTTGNIYGVYDMSGGAWEYVMGNYNDTISSSGFSSMPDKKYYNKYTSSTGKMGDATMETLKTSGTYGGGDGWYSDFTKFPPTNGQWFYRSGGNSDAKYAGVFYFYSSGGQSIKTISSRAVLSAQ
ncbi:MAG: prepilin-type N-terminal cleavage/methylation domain-containing protein [Acholeplasma sp.]|nr:prepilin-type N-terminal cleavage/methylation domain-containing protein [Acholeplasma sp.]